MPSNGYWHIKRMGVFPSFFDIITVYEMISFWLSMLQYLARIPIHPSACILILYLNLHPDEHIAVLLLELWLFMNDLADIIAHRSISSLGQSLVKMWQSFKFICKGRAVSNSIISCW